MEMVPENRKIHDDILIKDVINYKTLSILNSKVKKKKEEMELEKFNHQVIESKPKEEKSERRLEQIYLHRNIKEEEAENFQNFILKDVELMKKEDKIDTQNKFNITKTKIGNVNKLSQINDFKLKTEKPLKKNLSCLELGLNLKHTPRDNNFKVQFVKQCNKTLKLANEKIKSVPKKRDKLNNKFSKLVTSSVKTPEEKYFDKFLRKEVKKDRKRIPPDEIFEMNMMNGEGCFLKNKDKLYSILYKIDAVLNS
jgi:hypothetical protein